MTAVQYVGDDGTTYQLDQPSSYSGAGAGNLPPATGSEPVFPALWIPRYLLCFIIATPSTPRIHVICNASNPIYLGGPGTTFSIGAIGYKVERVYGENRPLL